MNDIFCAIDVGTTKIVAIITKKMKNGQIQVLGIGKSVSQGVNRGVVLNIEETVNSINIAKEEAERDAGIKMVNVFVGIAGQHIKSMRTHGYINLDGQDREITESDVENLILDMYKLPIENGEEILHVIPQSFTVDKESGINSPVGIAGRRLEANFHIITGQIASANNIKKCIERAGLIVEKLILEPLASAAAVLSDDEKEAGVVMIDIGGGTTDLVVYCDSIIRHTAVIPFGGNIITKDIKIGCNILQRHAEELKVMYGGALVNKMDENKIIAIPGIAGREPKEVRSITLTNIIQARMEEIIEAVFYEVELSGSTSKIGAGVVLTGGGALLNNLSKLIEYKTGFDSRIGFPSSEIIVEDSFSGAQHPIYSTSIGLILKGIEYSSKEENKNEDKSTNLDNKKQKVKIFDKILDKVGRFFDEKDKNFE